MAKDDHLEETNGNANGSTTFTMTDVTVVAPLDERVLLKPDTPLRDGRKLLSDDIASRLGQLVQHFSPMETLAKLRVVCTRFDPTKGQIRFVLQPVVAGAAQDAAVHVSYDLSSHDATRELARALARLSPPAPRTPQQSATAAQGLALDGPSERLVADLKAGVESRPDSYAMRLRETVRDYAARGSISRVTFMRNVDVKGNTWVFGGFDVDVVVAVNNQGTSSTMPVAIPRTGGGGDATEQRVVINGSWPFGISISPSPVAPGPQEATGALAPLLLDPIRLGIAFETNPQGARDRVLAGHASALALENPELHDTMNTDCASCHLASTVRRVAAHIATTRGFGPLEDQGLDRASNHNQRAPEPQNRAADQLRSCGYVGSDVVVNQRTINESALAAKRMGELL